MTRAMNAPSSPPLAITMGCPAGVGPEITVKAVARHIEAGSPFPCVVIGDRGIIERACRTTGHHAIIPLIREWKPGMEINGRAVNILCETSLDPDEISWGTETATTGKASYRYIIRAIELAMTGKSAGMVTAPISKAGLKMAGVSHPGHTEILAHETGTSDYAMMLAGSRLRVTLVTIHCPLEEVPRLITTESVLRLIRITSNSLQKLFGIEEPRVAVAALNPHAGEGGMFGDQESRIIGPAVQQAQQEGFDATGPLPPDTVFHAAWNGHFHAVVCMYHDQGLIPFKLVHFSDGVNITLGLPIIRTSVDHGTAYDIAGTGKASEESLLAAMDLANTFAQNLNIYGKTGA